MERSTRIAQIYGYAVCLVAIITILISLTQIVNAAVTSTLLIVIATGLFFMHWRWLRREDQTT